MATSGFGPGGLSPRGRSVEKVSLSGLVRVDTIYEDGQSAILVKESTDDKLRRKDIGTLIFMELSALFIPEKPVIKNLCDELRLDEIIYAEADPCPKTSVDQEYTFKALRVSKIFVGKGTIKELRKGYGYLYSAEHGNIFFPGASVTEDFGGLHDLSLTLRPGDEVRFTAWHQVPSNSTNCQFKAVEVSVFEMYSFEEDLPKLGFVAVCYQKACILYCKPLGSVHMNHDVIRSKTKPSQITLGMRFKFRYSMVPNHSRILGCRYKVEEAELCEVPLRTHKNETSRSFASADSTGFAKSISATGFVTTKTGSETGLTSSASGTGFPVSSRLGGGADSGAGGSLGGEATAEAPLDAVDENLKKLALEDWVADIEAELDWATDEDEDDTGITMNVIPTALSTHISETQSTYLDSAPKNTISNSRLDYQTASLEAANQSTIAPGLPPGLGETSDQDSRILETFPVEKDLNSRWNASVTTARQIYRDGTATFNPAPLFSTAEEPSFTTSQVPPFSTAKEPPYSTAQVPPFSATQMSQPQQALVRPFATALLTNNEYCATVTSQHNGNFIATPQYDQSPLQYSQMVLPGSEVLSEYRQSTCVNSVDSDAQTENELEEVVMLSRLMDDTEICALMCHKYPMLMAEYVSSTRRKPNNN